MFIVGLAENNHVVTLEQDGDDVNILVNGNLVAWFVDGELVVNEMGLEQVDLHYEIA